jgi:hypothetical protein
MKDHVWVATDLPAFQALENAIKLNDKYGIGELLAANRVTFADKNAEVLILESYNNGAYKVRVLNGVSTGQAVVVPVAWLKKTQ